jgi:hypothetical protein
VDDLQPSSAPLDTRRRTKRIKMELERIMTLKSEAMRLGLPTKVLTNIDKSDTSKRNDREVRAMTSMARAREMAWVRAWVRGLK